MLSLFDKTNLEVGFMENYDKCQLYIKNEYFSQLQLKQ